MWSIKTKLLSTWSLIIFIIICATGICNAQVIRGETAPLFSLKDLHGERRDLSVLKDRPMTIIYFFDVESRPSQEGLLALDQLAKKYRDADLLVWAVTLSPKERVRKFISKTKLSFPVLLDDSGVSDRYQARLILPTVCILGPDLKALDYFQGGGKTTEIMLAGLAERKLQQKQTILAKALSKEIARKNPQNVKAKTVNAYADLKEGNLDEAEKVFRDLAQKGGEGEILGKEGLATVYARKGQSEKALTVIREVQQKDPKRVYIHLVKGDLLYSQNKKAEAEAEYEKAAQKKVAEPYQKAAAYNRLGQLHASRGNYQRSRELYDQAVAIDPYNIEAMSNKGLTYEKEGKLGEALDAYRQVLKVDKNDAFAAVLARKTEEMLAIQRDAERKKRIDKLVKELAERFRSQQKFASKVEDTWTSRPMVLSFVDFQERGILAERDGISTVLTTQLTDLLNASGRVQVVERALLERLLEELNLGSSELADPETALRLGKVLAAKLIGTGSLYYLPDKTLLSLRLIDSETAGIPKIVNRQLGSVQYLGKEARELNREILRAVILKYPLQGYVVKTVGDQVIINLGSRQGVVLGTQFEILEEQEPIVYKGKTLSGAVKPIGQVEIVQVDPDLSYARVVNQERPLRRDDKIREKIVDIATIGVGNAPQ